MYKVVRGAVSKELTEFCYNYFRLKRKVVNLFRETSFITPLEDIEKFLGGVDKAEIGTGLNTYSHYSDIAMETLLEKLHPLMEKETNLTLYPAYSYARIYKNGDTLNRHKDRASCKVSTTLNLGGDPWPIFLEPSGKWNKKGIKVLLESGDMLIYDGCEMEHWREKFEGEDCGQVFLHYVETLDGKYDGRPFLGLPQMFHNLKKVSK